MMDFNTDSLQGIEKVYNAFNKISSKNKKFIMRISV